MRRLHLVTSAVKDLQKARETGFDMNHENRVQQYSKARKVNRGPPEDNPRSTWSKAHSELRLSGGSTVFRLKTVDTYAKGDRCLDYVSFLAVYRAAAEGAAAVAVACSGTSTDI